MTSSTCWKAANLPGPEGESPQVRSRQDGGHPTGGGICTEPAAELLSIPLPSRDSGIKQGQQCDSPAPPPVRTQAPGGLMLMFWGQETGECGLCDVTRPPENVRSCGESQLSVKPPAIMLRLCLRHQVVSENPEVKNTKSWFIHCKRI